MQMDLHAHAGTVSAVRFVAKNLHSSGFLCIFAAE